MVGCWIRAVLSLAPLCRECPPAHSLAAGRGCRQVHRTGAWPCQCCLVWITQTLPPGSLHTACFSSVFLEASTLRGSLGTFVLTFTQVYFGPHTKVLRLYYLIFSGQIAWSNEGAVLQSITAVLSVAGTEGQVLDGMRCAGPPQGAVVFVIVFLHSLLQGLFQTKHCHSNTQPDFSGKRLFSPEHTGRKLLCIQHERSEAMSLGAKQRVNHIVKCRVWSSTRRWSKANGVSPKLQGLILGCCKSAQFSITKVEDLTTWLYLCSAQQMIKYKCVWRWYGQYVRMKQECAWRPPNLQFVQSMPCISPSPFQYLCVNLEGSPC